MIQYIEPVVSYLIQQTDERGFSVILDDPKGFDAEGENDSGVALALNTAFLLALAGDSNPKSDWAKEFLVRMYESSSWSGVAGFYLNGIEMIQRELKGVCASDDDFRNRLESLSHWISNKEATDNRDEIRERIWSVFFPEANEILSDKEKGIEDLRDRRGVTITEANRDPIIHPDRQILFTSNVLLTVPDTTGGLGGLCLSDFLKERLEEISDEHQLYWYDHPIQMGVEPDKNEVLYGLGGLEEALEFERDRGNLTKDGKITCLLSVSVTHPSLHKISKVYLKELLAYPKGLKNIDVLVFSETDSKRIINEIIIPAAAHYLGRHDSGKLLAMIGVDGEYGRHYSFLKAISAFWSVLIQPEIKATFKIDLDQVFPQKELVDETGFTAFEHFKTELWGAKGLDSGGRPLELGMIAGALVNESDIKKSLFTADVLFPDREISIDEYIFFSVLPQALSTEAEMMTRYNGNRLDGKRNCIQRIHVTGGTNGILVKSLRRHRPFTPSFMGRAEDQAYILSTLMKESERLAYVHKDGLIMRHDKEAFAPEAIRSAHTAKLVGDYLRILYFSSYARALSKDVSWLKDMVDPFTGCFISKIPISVVYLRFALKATSFFSADRNSEGLEFIRIGSRRIPEAIQFISGEENKLKRQYEKERLGWNIYYDVLSCVENGLKGDDGFALGLKKKAREIIGQCHI